LKWKENLSENDTFAYSKRFNRHDFSRFCLVVIVSGDSPLNGAAVKTDYPSSLTDNRYSSRQVADGSDSYQRKRLELPRRMT
jgi:hypothetical protein